MLKEFTNELDKAEYKDKDKDKILGLSIRDIIEDFNITTLGKLNNMKRIQSTLKSKGVKTYDLIGIVK